MKQIITQHGWGLDQSFWDIYKVEFQKNNWYWQDNERGYFSKNAKQSKWIKNLSIQKIKMVLCHSFGFNLIPKRLLQEATHIVFINSFNNFLPLSNKRNLILRSLKRMEKKIMNYQTKDMLKEFIDRSFMPNNINIDFKKIFYKNLNNANNSLLLKDLKELSNDKDFPEFLNKNCNTIFIKSENDLILDEDANKNFFELLSQTLNKKPKLIELSNQGHCLTNLNLYEIINNTLDY